MSLELVPQHGLVLSTLVAGFLVQNVWMAKKVGDARKKYKVMYPTLYASDDHPDAKSFNCIQRAHQATLEWLPASSTLLLVAGARFPIAATAAGIVYLTGRILYFKGYSTGDPKKRNQGGFQMLGLLGLVGMVATWSVQLLLSK